MDVAAFGVMAAVTREATLFAGVGLLVGGLDDLAVDLVFLARRVVRRATGRTDPVLSDLPAPTGRYAILVAAWQEQAVIGAMLRTALDNLSHPHVRIYVGTYPNDPATIAAVAQVAADQPRVRPVVGVRAGPTTKAECLNTIWRALREDEAAAGVSYHAIVLHDAEDIVHPGELHVYEHGLRSADAVQLPVLPLPRTGAHMVGGTYLDEFAEAHAKQLVVRDAIGAGLPLAGVGCAVSRSTMERIADARGGRPFDASSLTEDYELGLTVAAMGGRTAMATCRERVNGLPVAVRAYFPDRLDTAVRQKTRWLIGIALAGWDRVGWSAPRQLGEHWMRMRDRRAPLAMLVLVAAYCALLLWVAGYAAALFGFAPPPASPRGWVAALLVVNGALLLWRGMMRAIFVGRHYGTAEALRSIPRMIVGNIVAMMAARRALFRYAAMLRGATVPWDKTVHQFPAASGPSQ